MNLDPRSESLNRLRSAPRVWLLSQTGNLSRDVHRYTVVDAKGNIVNEFVAIFTNDTAADTHADYLRSNCATVGAVPCSRAEAAVVLAHVGDESGFEVLVNPPASDVPSAHLGLILRDELQYALTVPR